MQDRPYWPTLIERVEVMVANGEHRHSISEAIFKEFGLPRQSFGIAVRRGDIPAMPAKDKLRAAARKAGETTYRSKTCVTCGSLIRYVADYRCVACDMKYAKTCAPMAETTMDGPHATHLL